MTTAIWSWPSIYDDDKPFRLTEAHIKDIRELVSYWSVTETGAAMLATADFEELEDVHEDDDPEDRAFLTALDIFLSLAELQSWTGTIRNPYSSNADEYTWLLSAAPDQDVVKDFRAGKDLAFQASEEEQQLWQAANLRNCGIDPKRPFGTGHVSRDIRAIIDPEKRLPAAKFRQRRKFLESRMVLLLQFFVQHAHIEPGLFQRIGGQFEWQPVNGDDVPSGEEIDICTWRSRTITPFVDMTRDFADTIKCLAHLAWNNRIEGRYIDHVKTFKLDNHYTLETNASYVGDLGEQVSTGLQHFCAEDCAECHAQLLIMAVRMHNAAGRHSAALALLKASAINLDSGKEPAWTTNDPFTLAWLERLIATYGSGEMSYDEYRSVLVGWHRGWPGWINDKLWSFVRSVIHAPDQADETAHTLKEGNFYDELLATCQQINLMRGGYVRDYEYKRY